MSGSTCACIHEARFATQHCDSSPPKGADRASTAHEGSLCLLQVSDNNNNNKQHGGCVRRPFDQEELKMLLDAHLRRGTKA
eukprot:3909413-Amphidinium_carterae.1